MKFPRIEQQAGYALLLVLLGLMGLGGVVIAEVTQRARQDAEEQRFEHNQRVLKKAKQALLMYAYHYPNTALTFSGNIRGPGRLPCPDTNNSGTPNPSADCIAAGVDMVGRFPWDADGMQFHDIRDASGERLWYAISQNFANPDIEVVNSDSVGTITIYDQSGGIIYDGDTLVGTGVAAVIIAPGPPLARDENNDGVYEYRQVRGTAAQQADPRNYLDTLYVQGAGANNEIDNSVFNNDESDSNDDGFIPGPVFDSNASDYMVNDQIIVVTVDEVMGMAEKAVLETYADAIENYRQDLWALPANYRYPWLSAYDDTTDLNWDVPAGTGVNMFDAQPGETTGRVPFLNYHEDHDSHVVVTDLQIDFDITLAYTSLVDNNVPPILSGYIDVFGALFTGFPAGPQTVDISRSNLSFSKTSFDGLADNIADNVGTLISRDDGATTVVNSAPSRTVRRYFWDGCPSCIEAADGWELCPVNTGDARDCAKNSSLPHNFEPFAGSWSSHADIRIRVVELTLEIDPDFEIELNYDPLVPVPAITAMVPPTVAANVRFTARYPASEVTDFSVADAVETNLRNFIDLKVEICDQDNYVSSQLNLNDYLAEPPGVANAADADTVFCTVDLVATAAGTFNNQFDVTADFYPQLPWWVADNNWDDALMMSYAADYGPGGGAACTPEDGDTSTGAADDCLVITNMGGVNNNIISLLVIAGQHDLLDGDDLNDDGDYLDANEVAPNSSFFDELHDIFEPENYSNIGPDPVPNTDPDPPSDTELELVFDKREDVVPGNAADTLFVLDQL